MKSFISLLFAALAVPAVALAQMSAPPPGSSAPQLGGPTAAALSEQDVEFAKKAAYGGQMEVALGKLAAEKAADPEVKRFAERMVQDHQKAGKKLKSIAQKLNLPLTQKPDEQARDLRNALADLSSDLFDKEYMWNMVAAHTVAVNAFEDQVDEGSNPQLVKFAENALSTLRDHRKSAVGLWEQVK